jgi:hypothetical protein
MNNPQKTVAPVVCNPLILLMPRSCPGVLAPVAPVTHKFLKSLCPGSALVVPWCVPHTPYTLRAPLGRRASVMKWEGMRIMERKAVTKDMSFVV